jgi:glucose 1-dehydrogenase
MGLENAMALVTGAASGIGRATAIALAKAGANVAVNDISPKVESVAEEVRALGRKAWACVVDVTSQDAVEAMVASLPTVNVFVSSAVFSEREPFTTADMAGFRKTFDVSMWGAFYGLRAVCKRMVAEGVRGSAVIVSSPHGQIAFPNCMAYNMAKAALDMMMKSAATEMMPHRIRVNAVYPGWTDTPGERKFLDDASIQQAATSLPWGRLATPEEIAHAVQFLADPESDYITGTILHVDGGLFLPWWSKRGTGDL